MWAADVGCGKARRDLARVRIAPNAGRQPDRATPIRTHCWGSRPPADHRASRGRGLELLNRRGKGRATLWWRAARRRRSARRRETRAALRRLRCSQPLPSPSRAEARADHRKEPQRVDLTDRQRDPQPAGARNGAGAAGRTPGGYRSIPATPEDRAGVDQGWIRAGCRKLPAACNAVLGAAENG